VEIYEKIKQNKLITPNNNGWPAIDILDKKINKVFYLESILLLWQ
jgi:hypothetical protein